jgi:hypothetical protein
MARSEPDDELKAPSSVADIRPKRNGSTWTHRQRRAGEQEIVGPQSPGGLLSASPDGRAAGVPTMRSSASVWNLPKGPRRSQRLLKGTSFVGGPSSRRRKTYSR